MHHDAKDRDPVWDCTLIKLMREKGSTVVNPIYNWSDDDVWNYIHANHIQTNPLYERGYKRVGCIGCPLATYKEKLKEFADYPGYKQLYVNAFQKMLEVGIANGKDYSRQDSTWTCGRCVFDWWIQQNKYEAAGQMELEKFMNER